MAGPGVDQDKQYCYPDHHHHNQVSSSSGLVDQNMLAATGHLQSFEASSDIYNLTSGMEMMIGFQQKNYLSQESHQATSGLWKPFLNRPHGGGPSSEFYQSEALAALPEWNHHQNPSLMASHVFACGGNERQRSQGLSLSLTSSNPSSIQLQSFELKRQSDDLSFGPSSFQIIRSSKYLGPAQELLIELCHLGTKQTDKVMKIQKNSEGMDEINGVKDQSLYSLDLPELQKRKTKLLLMLEQVDTRYKHYCDQMKAVVQSFEEVAGDGAATVYSFMASKAMSRHFRCLRDGVMTQIKATKKAIGDKDTAAPGATKGETPRLRVLDQTLRQQKAFHLMGFMESHPWRPQRGLPERSVSVLRAWLFEHFLHPYPTDVDKHILARQTGLSRSQVSNWFINARVRLWKPMVEEMYLEDVKEHDGGTANLDGKLDDLENQKHSRNDEDDQKPTQDQLFRIDSECLSSIINNINPVKDNGKRNKALANEYSATEFNFSSYNDHHRAPGSTVGGSGVSLTLGLHQHGGSSGGVSLAFSHQGTQSSLFYPRDQTEDCQTVPYSLLESDHQSQGLQYRNLMGAQLFHDFAG